MSIEQVIKLGNEIHKPDYGAFSEFTFVTWLVIIGLMILGVALFNWGVDGFLGFRMIIGIIMMTVSIVFFFGTIARSSAKEDAEYQKEVNKWRENLAKPYIESSPIEKKEVVYIKIDPEMSVKVEGSSWWGNGYTRSSVIERTPLTVSYKDNGISTRTNWFETHMELTKEDKPYIEFYRLPRDLGHNVNKGLYNVKIHLPESYKFTDIK
jgi:uncharacterized membrane protein